MNWRKSHSLVSTLAGPVSLLRLVDDDQPLPRALGDDGLAAVGRVVALLGHVVERQVGVAGLLALLSNVHPHNCSPIERSGQEIDAGDWY